VGGITPGMVEGIKACRILISKPQRKRHRGRKEDNKCT